MHNPNFHFEEIRFTHEHPKNYFGNRQILQEQIGPTIRTNEANPKKQPIDEKQKQIPNQKKGVRLSSTDLLGRELRCIRKNEVDRELGRDGGGSRGSRLHERERGSGRIDVRDDFLPGIDEGGVLGRRGREIGGEGANPGGKEGGGGGGGDGRSSQEAGSLSQHGWEELSRSARKVGEWEI